MKIKNPKTGEWVTIREFLRQWNEGMKRVTPLQMAITTQFGQVISMIGVIWGIIFSIRLGYWWMMVILIGGLIVLGVQMLATFQQKQILKQMDFMYQMSDPKDSISINQEIPEVINNGLS